MRVARLLAILYKNKTRKDLSFAVSDCHVFFTMFCYSANYLYPIKHDTPKSNDYS